MEHDSSILSAPDPVIFAANHNNSFETLLLEVLLISRRQGRIVSFINDWMFRYIPLVGWLIKMTDPIYVYNKKARLSFINRYRKDPGKNPVFCTCVERLQSGRSIGIFPEGTRNPDPFYLKKGRRGIGELVLTTGAPVIPIGIDFPARLKKSKIPVIGKTIFRIGKKMTFSQEHRLYQNAVDRGLETKKMRSRQSQLITTEVMQELSRLCGKQYAFAQNA